MEPVVSYRRVLLPAGWGRGLSYKNDGDARYLHLGLQAKNVVNLFWWNLIIKKITVAIFRVCYIIFAIMVPLFLLFKSGILHGSIKARATP